MDVYYFSIAYTVRCVEINLKNRPYMHWNVYTTDAQNLFQHILFTHQQMHFLLNLEKFKFT